MIHLGLIGYPLKHSLSPKIHAAALAACGLRGDYSLFPIRSDDLDGLKEVVRCIRSGQITGVNVTIPHKQNVIRFLDELTPVAKIGAVNTIYLQNNKLIGENTDAAGFLTDLNQFLARNRIESRGQRSALVLGAGGSARAVVYSLLKDGWEVMIAARRMEQAQPLASQFGNIPAVELGATAFRSFDFAQGRLSNVRLVVNTTPVGMAPDVDRSPWPDDVPFPAQAAIYDLVYTPGETRLVKEARAAGLPATTGLGMLIEQAALAFEIWTGRLPARATLFESVHS